MKKTTILFLLIPILETNAYAQDKIINVSLEKEILPSKPPSGAFQISTSRMPAKYHIALPLRLSEGLHHGSDRTDHTPTGHYSTKIGGRSQWPRTIHWLTQFLLYSFVGKEAVASQTSVGGRGPPGSVGPNANPNEVWSGHGESWYCFPNNPE